jgi:dipeptide/tripeptide permease
MAKRNPRGLKESIPNGSAVGEFNDYQQAVAYVDRLILGQFPPTSIAIVGTNLSSVERVRASISYGRVAFNGAAFGVWLGLIFYVLFGFGTPTPGTTTPEPLFNIGSALIVGAGFGMLFQVIRFSLIKNKSGFSSTSQVIAAKYEVIVPSDLLNEANAAYVKGGEEKA